MKPPPSRYRVVERGGRLVVIDSRSGGVPPTARDSLTDRREDDAPPSSYPRESGESAVENDVTREVPLRPSPYPARRSPIAALPGLLNNVASTVCSDRRDAEGWLQWTTARWFDAKGPRPVALLAKGEPQLGIAALALLAAAFLAVITAMAMGLVGWVMLVIAGSLLPKAKPAVTAWIDSLARA